MREYGYVVGQLLLTRDDLTHRKRHLNCRNTIQSLWRMGAIPVVNENDTVSVDEIKFGDNDTLAALVAGLIAADLLIILSDVDGVYDRNPQHRRGRPAPAGDREHHPRAAASCRRPGHAVRQRRV